MSPLVLYTDLTEHECFEQLKRACRSKEWQSRIDCTFFKEGFNLSLIRGYKNPYAPIFTGRFETVNGKTQIRGKFVFRKVPVAMLLLAILVTAVIFLVTTLANLPIFIAQIASGVSITPMLTKGIEVVGVFLFMVLGICYTLCKGWELGKPEEAIILQFVVSTLQTRFQTTPNHIS